MSPDTTASWPWPEPYDFIETTRLLRTGGNDPGFRRETGGFWRAVHTTDGPASVYVQAETGARLTASAWGAGADAALAQVPGWLGLTDAPWKLPQHPVTDRLLRHFPGLRLTDCGSVFDALLIVVLQQLVTWNEAVFAWRRLLECAGTAAPGPAGLRLPPTPAELREFGVEAMVGLGIGQKRAAALFEIAFAASRLETIRDLPTVPAFRRLAEVRGIGQWTAAMTLGLKLGRPEPAVLGDVHLPNTVCWALAGEARGTDRRMLELLEPFDGQAFRVIRLLFAARINAPRRAPKREVRFGR